MSQHTPVGNCLGLMKSVFKFVLGVLLAENSSNIPGSSQTLFLSLLKMRRLGYFPDSPVIKTPSFYYREHGFKSLVGKLRSCMPWPKDKIKTKGYLNIHIIKMNF